MAFDIELFHTNLKGITQSDFNDADLIDLVFALNESGQNHVASLIAFSQSLRLQLKDLKGNYYFVLKEK